MAKRKYNELEMIQGDGGGNGGFGPGQGRAENGDWERMNGARTTAGTGAPAVRPISSQRRRLRAAGKRASALSERFALRAFIR